jgi:adenylate cyclase
VLAALTGSIMGGVYALSEFGLWVGLVYPCSALTLVYLSSTVTRAVLVEVRARRIRQQFATYVPPDVVSQMVDHPQSFRLGGERRHLSILFSDLRGFTTLAESLDAEDVAELLKESLTPMTRIIFERRGTLDKYIGDAIVAFWGAPLDVDDHETLACEAAFQMQKALAELRRTHASRPGFDQLRMGIGLHCGEVVVGNMGSELRFDYTITGDDVNLCSRLEGLSKIYGVEVLASEALVARTQGFLYRELDVIRVKGKQRSVAIYEILGPQGIRIDPELLEVYAKGLLAYRGGRFDDAVSAFSRGLEIRPDGPCALLLERSQRLLHQRPSLWDGVWSFSEK